jgi:hypothetical protein
MFRHVERQATRMADMIQKVEVDTTKLVRLRVGVAYAEARTNCLQCRNSRECLLWLDAIPASGETPTFCPNFELFESCKRSSSDSLRACN